MKLADLLQLRLRNQQITQSRFSAPADVVSWLGAVQAQDYGMAKWAIGLRVLCATNETIERAINDGAIIRTHLLRPTWHFVAATDIHWMLQLTGPHIKRAIASMNRKLELDEAVFRKTNGLIIKSLSGNKHLTRQELMIHINKAGIATDPLRAAHIMFQAELDGLVCNGPLRGKQFTYALLEERVPARTKKLIREEALIALTMRYFTSHGPATVADFAWWSGLPVTEIKTALEAIKSNLSSEIIAGKTYWFYEPAWAFEKVSSLHLLPAYDEFMVSYKDRAASLPQEFTRHTITGNGIFRPVVIVNGRTVGLWKPVKAAQDTQVEIQLFDPSGALNKKLIAAALKKYAAFTNTKLHTGNQPIQT